MASSFGSSSSFASELNVIVFNYLAGVYRDPSRIIMDAASLRSTDLGSRLDPVADPLIMNDGSELTVLMLKGTIPMTYRGREYHIPIDVYVPPQYPVRPPIIYVRPAPTMTIKVNHPNVGQDGMVYMPYLHDWDPDTHDLTMTAMFLSIIFGEDPPCYRRNNVDPPPPPYPDFNIGGGQYRPEQTRREKERIAREEEARLAEIARREKAEQEAKIARDATLESERIAREEEARLVLTLAEIARREKAEQEAKIAREARREAERIAREEEARLAEEARLNSERDDVIFAATSRVKLAMESLCDRAREELKVELRDQKRLEASKKLIDVLLEEGKKQKAKLVTVNSELEESTLVLQRWLTTVEEERQRRRGLEYNNEVGNRREDWDENGAITDLLAIPADTRSAQMLALSAESAAIDDCIYYLDMALESRNLTMEVYLGEVRKLTKRQFLAKAHLMKIERESQAAEYR